LWDDLIKAKDANSDAAIETACEFLFRTLPTRRANPSTTRTIGIMQRLNDRDPAGRVIEQGGVTVVTLPMRYDPDRHCTISLPPSPSTKQPARVVEDPRTERGELLWPERFPAEDVSTLAERLGPAQASAQLDQDPVPPKGLIFQTSYFDRRWSTLPKTARRILVVDCTFKDTDRSDWVVIQEWAASGSKIYLVDERRGRWNFAATMAQIKAKVADSKGILGIYIEDKANGSGIISTLKDNVAGIVPYNPGTKSKSERAETVLPVLEAGDVWFPPDSEAPWFVDYVKELVRFPKGRHDDRVDATTMALAILGRRSIQRMIKAYSEAGKLANG
jgi:predicted phage terminase large subunit-like protein